MIDIRPISLPRVAQGDIFRKINYFKSFTLENGTVTVELIEFPFILVMTQDCDLLQEHDDKERNRDTNLFDKRMISTLVVPLYNADQFWLGQHVSELNYTARPIPSKEKEKIIQNQVPRYHFLSFPRRIAMVNMVIDFKHYFSVNSSFLFDSLADRVCSVAELFREDISHRFSFYLSRIGLPELQNP